LCFARQVVPAISTFSPIILKIKAERSSADTNSQVDLSVVTNGQKRELKDREQETNGMASFCKNTIRYQNEERAFSENRTSHLRSQS
jgi:nitroimidazol reductase NimA-like FMN-containing flavoprotein (pyridoxamine 5'-phosphate oxidase superfamily)